MRCRAAIVGALVGEQQKRGPRKHKKHVEWIIEQNSEASLWSFDYQRHNERIHIPEYWPPRKLPSTMPTRASRCDEWTSSWSSYVLIFEFAMEDVVLLWKNVSTKIGNVCRFCVLCWTCSKSRPFWFQQAGERIPLTGMANFVMLQLKLYSELTLTNFAILYITSEYLGLWQYKLNWAVQILLCCISPQYT